MNKKVINFFLSFFFFTVRMVDDSNDQTGLFGRQ